MDRSEFIRKAKERWPHKDDQVPLQAALFERLERESEPARLSTHYYDLDISNVIQRAGVIKSQKTPLPEKRLVMSAPPGMREIIGAEQIADQHKKEMRSFRFRLFGSPKPPFSNVGLGLDWIDKVFESGGGSCSNVWIPYPSAADSSGEVGGFDKRFVGKKTPLYRLAREIWELSKATTFDPLSVMWWILVGSRPTIPRYRVFRHTAYPLFPYLPAHDWVTLEIRASDITFEELRQIHKQLPKIKGKRRQKVNRWHHRIYELVKEYGSIPKRGSGKVMFWETIGKQIKKEGCKKPPSWRGIRKAYIEIRQISSQHQHIGTLVFEILNRKRQGKRQAVKRR